ncbi:hypothetical protein EAI_12266 [Harpegnathos saltator]|uniref:Uncharacterized protein n=1 Tax=Harpegnathos saltator TaxID=610380 RepID=E2BC83_HARSA|nr:hypothetical protein EAI_12266 [Harpegnathos saltator]
MTIAEGPAGGDDIEASEAAAAEKEMLVNVNCPIRIVLNYIREVAQLSGTRRERPDGKSHAAPNGESGEEVLRDYGENAKTVAESYVR